MIKERILIVLAVVIAIGIGIYAVKRVAPPAELVIQTTTIQEEVQNPPAIIKAEYPVITGFRSKSAEFSLNQTIKSAIETSIASFKEEIKDMIIFPGEQNQRSEFGSKFKIGIATSSFVSILFNNYTYSAGAAHPNSYVQSFNYDVVYNRAITLGDLFKTATPYLQRIADKGIAGLLEQFSADREGLEDWIKSGAAPTQENYQVFLMTPDGLLIIYNTYQVGPYAIGAPEVLIPYAEFADIIAPQGPIGSHARRDETAN